jgi:hypothetical protein
MSTALKRRRPRSPEAVLPGYTISRFPPSMTDPKREIDGLRRVPENLGIEEDDEGGATWAPPVIISVSSCRKCAVGAMRP